MKWATNKANIAAFQGAFSYGDGKIKCLQGLVYWITYQTMHWKPVILTDFDQKILDLIIDMGCIHNDEQ